jgi:glycosyltransferase involved in cell wall biosynthesis
MREPKLGVVAIGRNEGERLRSCLNSVLKWVPATVYVDSGSHDGSKELASAMGATVVDLDMSRPFTAARARNEGLRLLLTQHPDIDFVQFVDGDCEIVPGWLEAARDFLDNHASHAVVCGRRRERYPERSVYNRLCDEEWNTPIGNALSCGGDAMFRRQCLEEAGGYRESLIAGEEPELCLRLRQKGWLVHRLDQEMTLHDAAITRFSQWWKRTVRAGHAFAEGAWLHGAPPERHWVRETRRAWLWGILLPLLIILAIMGMGPWAGLMVLAYPLQWWRLVRRNGSAVSSAFLVLGKFAEAWGMVKFHMARLRGMAGSIIEYK